MATRPRLADQQSGILSLPGEAYLGLFTWGQLKCPVVEEGRTKAMDVNTDQDGQCSCH